MTPVAPANKGKKYPAETLAPTEVADLIAAQRGNSSTALRNRALIAVTFSGALRIGEALSLRPHSLDLDAGSIRILEGKGRKSRTVGISREASALAQAWMERRTKIGLDGRQNLFCTLKGKPLATSYVRRLLPQLADKAGLQRRVHPHLLRHSRAKELVEQGTPIPVIQAALGHSHLTTTSIYLDHVAPKQVIEAMQTSALKV